MPGLQIAFERRETAGIRICSGRDAEYSFECPLQMKRAQVECVGQPLQCQRLVQMLLNVTTDGFHHLRLSVPVDGFRPAPQAGAIARPFGFFGPVEKRDILTPRPLRRT